MAIIAVTVLKEGTYLDGDLNGQAAQANDVINVFEGPYANLLVERGWVTLLTEGEIALPAGEVLHEAKEGAPPTPPAPEADADPVGALMEINGIGQKTAVRLVDGGITSIAAFVAADPVELSETAGTTVAKIQGWQAAASKLEA
jgi:hypothetical protein